MADIDNIQQYVQLPSPLTEHMEAFRRLVSQPDFKLPTALQVANRTSDSLTYSQNIHGYTMTNHSNHTSIANLIAKAASKMTILNIDIEFVNQPQKDWFAYSN